MSETLYANLAKHGTVELPRTIGGNKWIRKTLYDQRYWNALFTANMTIAFIYISFFVLTILSHSHCIASCKLEEHLGGSFLIWNAVAGCLVSGTLIYFVVRRMISDESMLYFHSKTAPDDNYSPEAYLATADMPTDLTSFYNN